MIAASSVTLRAGARTLLHDASFEIARGEFVAVLGANGVGKTTLLRTLAGIRAPESGHVEMNGTPLTHFTVAQRARSIAHCTSDDLFLDQLLVCDVVAMGRFAHRRWWQWTREPGDDAAVAHALHAVHMEAFALRRFDTLSSGERQRVWIALALAQEAPLLLLDEPTSHLDVRVAREILQLLRAQVRAGKTVICALHDLNEAAEFADRVLLLGCAELLAFGAPAQALTPALLERAYGIQMETVENEQGILRVFPAAAESAIRTAR